jgi:archaellum component FlaC
MSEVQKISEEQLNELNRLVNTIKFVSQKVTELSVEKSLAVDAYKQLQESLEEIKGKIREEFGDVDIDLQTGEVKKVEQVEE